MRTETLAIHAGRLTDPGTGAVSAGICLSTTFERDADGSYPRGYVYSRGANPNRLALEQAMAAIEGGSEAAAFGSGLAATAAVFQALRPGDHVVVAQETYHGTTKLLRDVFVPWGLQISFVDMINTDAVAAAVRPDTKLLWAETPSNPLLKITDLSAVAGIAHSVGALCACDNTLVPIVQKPFACGVDLVVHSTTKYIGGHCDVTGGVVITKRPNELFERVRSLQGTAGAVPAPFDCWLVLRGVRTLPWRMRAHCENALQVAKFLNGAAGVAAVHYPGLPKHPKHDLARRQMSAFGGLLSFEVKEGRDAAIRVASKTKLFIQATSLGGVESLIEHRASVVGESAATPQALLRCSVGLEHADDLIEDLAQALG